MLVACEFSGRVRAAFRKRGWDAWSCDLLPADDGDEHHIQGDVLPIIYGYGYPWDMMIAFPPCTYLCSSGLHWNTRRPERKALTEDALEFVQKLLDAPIPKKALENPIGCISTRIRKPDQKIQPWQFGHGEVKATCLWLENLPPLTPTNIVEDREPKVWKAAPGPDRWKLRSLTYQGIADAMAEQWS